MYMLGEFVPFPWSIMNRYSQWDNETHTYMYMVRREEEEGRGVKKASCK